MYLDLNTDQIHLLFNEFKKYNFDYICAWRYFLMQQKVHDESHSEREYYQIKSFLFVFLVNHFVL
jgi:hypothetical protein